MFNDKLCAIDETGQPFMIIDDVESFKELFVLDELEILEWLESKRQQNQ